MILVDALHINNGGGKVLLDYLIESFESTELKVSYLLDDRVIDDIHKIKSTNEVVFMNATFINRLLFYRTNLKKFKKIFCFGNIPPIFDTGIKTYTYFHNPMYLNVPRDFSNFQKIIYKFKSLILKKCSKNTFKFIVQSEFIKKELALKYQLNESKILVLPFYPPLPTTSKVERIKNSFLYVSNGTPNKNHEKLINAFCKFYDTYKLGKLTLTISPVFIKVHNYIEEKKIMGYPITNIGFVNRNELKINYLNSEYLIFPSLAESFGLGIVEAIENGCKVIGANLPYLYEVCKPSLVFDPLLEEDIMDAMKIACFTNLDNSERLIKNDIKEIIRLIAGEN